jgi:hypothetical protein
MARQAEAGPSGQKQIAVHEAEILICLLPAVRDVRSQGKPVGWTREYGPNLNVADFYHFWVLSPDDEGVSPNIGHFSVNRHTGEVWNGVTEKKIESPDLSAVQEILRLAHRITESDVKQYGTVSMWRPAEH